LLRKGNPLINYSKNIKEETIYSLKRKKVIKILLIKVSWWWWFIKKNLKPLTRLNFCYYSHLIFGQLLKIFSIKRKNSFC
jgi:hypothetical protein